MLFVPAKQGRFCLWFRKSIAIEENAAVAYYSVHHFKNVTHVDNCKGVPSSHVFRAYGVVGASWQTQQTRQCSRCQNSVANKENHVLFTLPEQRGKQSESDIMLHAAWQTKQTRHCLFCHIAWQTKQTRHCLSCQYSLANEANQTSLTLPVQPTNKANQTLLTLPVQPTNKANQKLLTLPVQPPEKQSKPDSVHNIAIKPDKQLKQTRHFWEFGHTAWQTNQTRAY